jgi:hypothetical protein
MRKRKTKNAGACINSAELNNSEEQKNIDELWLLKGEFLSLMASTEYYLSQLIVEYLRIENHAQEFQDWFVTAPINFGCKVDLFRILSSEDSQLDRFRSELNSLDSLLEYRNILAHSFGDHFGARTAKGRVIPAKKVTLPVLKSKIGILRMVDNLILNILVDFQTGPIPPCSADDFADGPM